MSINYKKCPLKKRPIVYETEEISVNLKPKIDEKPQDLSLKRKSNDTFDDYEPPVKREYGLDLSKKVENVTVQYRSESPISVGNESSVLLSPHLKDEQQFIDYYQPSNIHLRGLTSATTGYTTNPYQTAFVMAAGCNPMTALWHNYQHISTDLSAIYPSPVSSLQSPASNYSYSSHHMTPPSSPGSEDSASEPEDLTMRSDIPLPALFHQFEETSRHSARSSHSLSHSTSSAFSHSSNKTTSSNSRHFKCDKCNKAYATESGLKKHEAFHCPATIDNQHKQKYICPECGKVNNSSGALKMHIRTHTLPCKCLECGKCFSRPWLLQGHIRTHTGEKPFGCNVCSRRFADRSNLRAHQQTHVEIKKYVCSVCNKSFSRASLLKKHSDSNCVITIV